MVFQLRVGREQGGQGCIRGQVALRPLGIDTIPITNVANACASGATAFDELHQAQNLGFRPRGEGGRLAASGATRLKSRIPINTSGGHTS